MSDDPIKVAAVVASTRPGRIGPVVARWFTGQASRHSAMSVQTVDLATAEPSGNVFSSTIRAADAIVIVTPEYNHSFPGPLKTAVDSLRSEWFAKPIGLVTYGGISGGLRAAEALRLVFAELHAVTIRETVSFAHVWDRFDRSGDLVEPDAAAAATVRMLDQLVWWAVTLKAGRAREPYSA